MSAIKAMIRSDHGRGDTYKTYTIPLSIHDRPDQILPELDVIYSTVSAPFDWKDAHGFINILTGSSPDIVPYMMHFRFDVGPYGGEEFALIEGHALGRRIMTLAEQYLPDDHRPSAVYFMLDGPVQNYKPHLGGKFADREYGAAYFNPAARRGKTHRQLNKVQTVLI